MVVEARKKRKSNKLQNMQKLKPDWKKKNDERGTVFDYCYLSLGVCMKNQLIDCLSSIITINL